MPCVWENEISSFPQVLFTLDKFKIWNYWQKLYPVQEQSTTCVVNNIQMVVFFIALFVF